MISTHSSYFATTLYGIKYKLSSDGIKGNVLGRINTKYKYKQSASYVECTVTDWFSFTAVVR